MALFFDPVRDGIPAINTAAAALAQAEEEVSTGKAWQTIAGNPTAAARAVTDHTEIGILDAYTSTANAVSTRQSAADSTLTDIINQLTSAMSNVTSAQGTTSTTSSRQAAVDALQSIRASIASDVNTTFQGTYLFSGSQVTKAAYAQVGGVWTYQGDNAPVSVQVNTGTKVQETWDGQAILQGSAATDVLTTLDTVAAAVQANDQAGMAKGLADLQAAFSRATVAQDALGSDENSVSTATSRLTTLTLATQTRQSQDEDANLAEASTQMAQAQTAYQAALMTVAQSKQLSLFNFM